MTGFRLSPAARDDLASIWDFSEQRWGIEQAERYVLELGASIERIAEDPARGRACDEIRDGYRRYAVGSHLVFFISTADGVDVIRILHQRMDPDRHV